MAFFLFKANTFSEYADSYYAVATTTLLFYTLQCFEETDYLMISNMLLKSVGQTSRFTLKVNLNFFEIITGVESPISTAINREATEKVDTWAENFYFGFTKIIFPGIVLPLLVMSYFVYFTNSLGSHAFHLPILVW